MVEAAGIEPASEKFRTEASTRLADSFFYLTRHPLNGKWVSSQPLKFRPTARGVTVELSRICVAWSNRPGQAIRQTSQLKLRRRADCCQLLLCHLINEVGGASTCYSSLLLPVESCSPPIGLVLS